MAHKKSPALASFTSLAGAASLLLTAAPAHADQAPSSTTHVVQSGETLSEIASEAGVDPSALANLNGIDNPNVLSVGESLTLPTPGNSHTPSAAAAPQTTTYTVADGDTLSAIALQYGTTVEALAQLNALEDPGVLSVGRVLTVPSRAPAPTPVVGTAPTPTTATAVATSPASPSAKTVLTPYTVQPGETLSGIARQFGVSSAAIAQASGLDDPNKIGVGTVLKVPLPAKEHTVASGETLRDIAAAEKVDLGSLIDFNQLDDPELIRVGQVLLLPLAVSLQAATVDATPVPASTSAPTPTPAVTPSPAATQTPSPTPTPVPAVSSAPAPAKPNSTAKAAPPQVVATRPPGAPSDGLAGAALKLLGAPYIWGGSSPTSGFDCSGFVWYVARQLGKPLSRGLLGQYNSGSHPGRDELKVGDLVFFQNTYVAGLSHNGIYIGNGQFVHAADETAGVTISSIGTAYWSSHWFGATRVP